MFLKVLTLSNISSLNVSTGGSGMTRASSLLFTGRSWLSSSPSLSSSSTWCLACASWSTSWCLTSPPASTSRSSVRGIWPRRLYRQVINHLSWTLLKLSNLNVSSYFLLRWLFFRSIIVVPFHWTMLVAL